MKTAEKMKVGDVVEASVTWKNGSTTVVSGKLVARRGRRV